MTPFWKIGPYQKAANALLYAATGRPLKGVSLTSTESPQSYMFYDTSFSKADGVATFNNIARTLKERWGCTIVRIPLCMNIYANDTPVQSFLDSDLTYQSFIGMLVSAFNNNGQVVILDGHVWSDATASGWTGDCPSSNAYPPVDIESVMPTIGGSSNFIYNNLIQVWAQIADQYKDNPNVFFEIFNEPRMKNLSDPPDTYDWKRWQTIMLGLTDAIRDKATSQVIIIGGLDFGYVFTPSAGNTSFQQDFGGDVDKLYSPFLSRGNIAFNMHPYQHGSCCGQVTDETGSTDLSATDPYYQTFCTFYEKGGQATDYDAWTQTEPSNTYLYPKEASGASTKCQSHGLTSTVPNKMPPCKWKDITVGDKTGICTGDTSICLPITDSTACDANTTQAGWDQNLGTIAQYGPIIMTEFGTYDCSTPYIDALLTYAEQHGIAWTAWSIWLQNSGGGINNGACGYPSIIMNDNVTGGSLKGCRPAATLQDGGCMEQSLCTSMCSSDNPCDAVLIPLGKYGELIQSYMLDKRGPSVVEEQSSQKATPEENADFEWWFWALICVLVILLMIIIVSLLVTVFRTFL